MTLPELVAELTDACRRMEARTGITAPEIAVVDSLDRPVRFVAAGNRRIVLYIEPDEGATA